MTGARADRRDPVGPAAEPLVSVVVVSFNTRDLLRQCLASVGRHLALPHELVVVDNASRDGSADMVAAEFPQARLLRNDENLGFGRANNAGMAQARGDVFVLLNSDAWLEDGSLAQIVAVVRARPELGIAGPRLRHPDGRLQPSAYRFGSPGRLALEELGIYKLLSSARRAELLLGGYWDHAHEREADWVVGACMAVRREAFERTAGFDPALFLYGEEVEWCWRVRAAGLRVLYWPQAEVVHLGRGSALQSLGAAGRLDRCLLADDALTRRWYGQGAALLAPLVRVAGALLKLLAFALRGLTRGLDDSGREALWTARAVLDHYGRRARGKLRPLVLPPAPATVAPRRPAAEPAP